MLKKIKVGTLVRWHGGCTSNSDDDIGIVTQTAETQPWTYRVYWSVENNTDEFNGEQIEESMFQGQLEIIG